MPEESEVQHSERENGIDSNQDSESDKVQLALARFRAVFDPPGQREKLAKVISESIDYPKYSKDLFQRLGIIIEEGETPQEFWRHHRTAARYVGISDDDFWSMTPRDLCDTLELKARELALFRAAASTKQIRRGPSGSKAEPRKPGRGRPAGVCIKGEGEHLRHHRTQLNLTQQQLAEQCGIPSRSIQRAESGKGMDEATINAILNGLNITLPVKLSRADLVVAQ